MKRYLILLLIFAVQLVNVPASANLLPPRLTYFTSSSIALTGNVESKKFRVDNASLRIRCDRRNCTVDAEYIITSSRSAETSLSFVLPRPVKVQATVNDAPVPVGMASAFKSAPPPIKWINPYQMMKFEFLSTKDRVTDIYYAIFPASFRKGKNIIRVRYGQVYNHDLGQYRKRTIQQLRYELWPLANWYVANTFTMTVSAEFTDTVPGEDELLVHYYKNLLGIPLEYSYYLNSGSISDLEKQWKPSSSVERFTSSTSTILFEKQWKQDFPDRIVWFVGEKEGIEVSEGFFLYRQRK